MKPIDIILLTYNHSGMTRDCLVSLEKCTSIPYRLIWVDNASQDGERAAMESKIKDLEIDYIKIWNKHNLGFAKAINKGIKKVESEYFVILNNDIILTPGWLKGLVKVLEKNKNTALVGPLVDNIGGYQKISEHPGCKYENEKMIIPGNYEHVIFPKNRNIAYFCTLFRYSVFKEVGYLHDGFYLYGEDDEFNDRVRLFGYDTAITREVFVYHEYSKTINEIPGREQIREKSRELLKELLKERNLERRKYGL